jgi:hypothetical protein
MNDIAPEVVVVVPLKLCMLRTMADAIQKIS